MPRTVDIDNLRRLSDLINGEVSTKEIANQLGYNKTASLYPTMTRHAVYLISNLSTYKKNKLKAMLVSERALTDIHKITSIPLTLINAAFLLHKIGDYPE